MTIKNIKFGKIFIVVFLTMLIWVWADLAQDERLALPDVAITVAKASNPALWASFVDQQEEPDLQASVTLDSVILKGPASRVAEVRRRKNQGKLDLGLFVVPEQEGMTTAGLHTLDVLDFLKQSDEFRQLGLTVESCEPRKLTLRVQELVKTTVPVECLGVDDAVQVNVVPEMVEAYVPRDGARKALVRLSADDQKKAKNTAVEKTPYVELIPGGQRRDVQDKVKITLAPAQNPLRSCHINTVVGFCFSQNTQGKYRVVLKNDPTELAGIMIKATPGAEHLYAQQTVPQLILYIQDSDRQATELIQRAVVFNFPDESLQKGEIELDQPAPVAKFILQPITETPAETTTETMP